jgi:hypothetical protein
MDCAPTAESFRGSVDASSFITEDMSIDCRKDKFNFQRPPSYTCMAELVYISPTQQSKVDTTAGTACWRAIQEIDLGDLSKTNGWLRDMCGESSCRGQGGAT